MKGEWKSGKKHGQGTYTWTDGDKYTGEFMDGIINGQGTYSFSNGMKYVGKFRNAKYNGQGTLTLPDGRKVIGEFREDKPWNVKLFNKNENIQSRWMNGVKVVEKKKEGVLFGRIVNGNPEWHKVGYNNDERYVGEIENEKPNGQGTLTLPDGRKFVGKFKDGKMDGQGTFTFPDRTKGVGYFRGTKPWNVTKYDKGGNIL